MYISKIKTPFLISLYLLSICIFFTSCKKQEEFVGPAICPSAAFETKFSSFNTLPASLDLSTTPLNLKATFTESILWTVTITGENGAQRIYSDKSNELAIEWSGEPGNTTFFEDGLITIEFKIACRDAIKYTMNIAANDFTNYSANGKGIVISDFDGTGTVNNTYQLLPVAGYIAGGWSSYYTMPMNKLTELAIHQGDFSHRNSSDQYFTVKGQAGADYWSCGGTYADVNLSAISTSADSTYFNALINPGSTKNTILAISFKSNGVNYTKMVTIDWTGWKMVSFKLSEFNLYDIPLTNLDKTSSIEFGLNCEKAPGQSAEANIDFIIITAGEPFLGN